jgi:hypothetical protein
LNRTNRTPIPTNNNITKQNILRRNLFGTRPGTLFTPQNIRNKEQPTERQCLQDLGIYKDERLYITKSYLDYPTTTENKFSANRFPPNRLQLEALLFVLAPALVPEQYDRPISKTIVDLNKILANKKK